MDDLQPNTYRYTAPDGTVTVRKLTDWDALHDRLEATGMCVADRKLDQVIHNDRARAKRA